MVSTSGLHKVRAEEFDAVRSLGGNERERAIKLDENGSGLALENLGHRNQYRVKARAQIRHAMRSAEPQEGYGYLLRLLLEQRDVGNVTRETQRGRRDSLSYPESCVGGDSIT